MFQITPIVYDIIIVDDAELEKDEKEDAVYWYGLEKYIPGVEDELDMPYEYTIAPNGEIWFTDNAYFPHRDFASSQDLNLPVPFEIGDIITIDCRPFAPLKHAVIVEMPDVKNRSYAIIQDNYLVTVELTEDENVSEPEELIYEETITAYDLNNGLNQEFEIVRKIEPRDTKEMKNYQMKQGDSWWIYALGYGRYTAEGATFISTEQEFCDKANELLRGIAVENITMIKTSWNSYKSYEEDIRETKRHQFSFVDAEGNYRRWGDGFIDCKGNYVQWGGTFVDGAGNYVSWGNSFVDGGGSHRRWGDDFVDGAGNYVPWAE